MVQLIDVDTFGYERVVHIADPGTGLEGFISIHSSKRGPALGGLRFLPYVNHEEALADVLRLSETMTYKAAAAGLPFGGGKAVIIGDPQWDKTPELLAEFGRAVDMLNGHYITAEDVGTSVEDIAVVARATRWVAGLPSNQGGSDDPSPATAEGVLFAMRAVARFLWGEETLRGCRVLVQGVGKVGGALTEMLLNAGAHVVIADVDTVRVEAVRRDTPSVEIADAESCLVIDCDILAPCALGGILSQSVVPDLRCKAIVGSANNQLRTHDVGAAIAEREIAYIPDFIANAGGIINIASEFGYTNSDVSLALQRIGETADRLLRDCFTAKISTHQSAIALAQRAIDGG